MSNQYGPRIVTDGLVLCLDAANTKSYAPILENTSLVLNMEGSNGSTTFTDGSKYKHTVTANGNAQISTTNSRFGGSSAYFDGNGDYLFISNNSVFNLESSDFTIEANVFLTGYAQNNQGYYQSMIFCKDDFGLRSYTLQIGGTSNSWTSVNFTLFVTNTNTSAYSASFNFELNRWYHIAAVRKGQSIRIYVDGIDTGGGTAVNPQTTSANLHIGGYGAASGFNSYGYYYNHPGYIDSLRVVKGQALYTSNFTPPKKSFPENNWNDVSGNNNGSLINGVSYNSQNNGSLSFDGVNDYVSIGSQNLIGTGTSPFSTELWFYNTRDFSNGQYTLPIRIKQDTEFFLSLYNPSGILNIYPAFRGNTQWGIPVIKADYINKWISICIVYNGGNKSSASSYLTYVNGIQLPYGTNNFGTAGGTNSNCNIIGADGNSGCNVFGGYYQGNIGTYKIYNNALSAAEIRQNFEATKGRYGL